MRKGIRLLSIAVLAVALALGVGLAQAADDLSPEDFFGHYKGSGASRGPNVTYYELTLRDLDVQIGPEDNGFYVAWTTVIRDYWEKESRRRSARVTFEPSGRAGIYMERAAADRVTEGLTWAAITGDTLTVRVLAIVDDGSYAVQTYHRMLTEKGMFLHFLSDRDGRTIRMVSAQLTKVE
jgi:hypothetical protein